MKHAKKKLVKALGTRLFSYKSKYKKVGVYCNMENKVKRFEHRPFCQRET